MNQITWIPHPSNCCTRSVNKKRIYFANKKERMNCQGSCELERQRCRNSVRTSCPVHSSCPLSQLLQGWPSNPSQCVPHILHRPPSLSPRCSQIETQTTQWLCKSSSIVQICSEWAPFPIILWVVGRPEHSGEQTRGGWRHPCHSLSHLSMRFYRHLGVSEVLVKTWGASK